MLLCGLLGNAMVMGQAIRTPLPVSDESGLSFQTYSSDDGLNDEIWSTVGSDRDGTIWAGSASRLASFDGYQWKLEDFPAARSLVRDMVQAPDGSLQVAFEREGLARRNGHGWELLAQPGGLIRRFSRVHEGDGRPQSLWMIVTRTGFYRWVDGDWVKASEVPAAPGPEVDIEQTSRLFGERRQWIGTEIDGLWYRSLDTPRSGWQRFAHPVIDQMPMSDLLRTESEGQEELWLVSYNGGLARVREGGVDVWRAAGGELPTEAMYAALVSYAADGTRNLWVSTRAGLLQRHGERFVVHDRRHGLPSDAVRGLHLSRTVDGIPLLWLATEGGLARAVLTESPWRTLSLFGARNNGIFGLLLEPDGTGSEQLWIGSGQEGLARLRAGQWRRFDVENGGLPGNSVRAILRLPEPSGGHRRLVSLGDGPLLDYSDEDRPLPMQVPWSAQLGNAATDAVGWVEAGRQQWWFANLRDGIYHYDGERWQRHLANGASQPWQVYDLLLQVDGQGRRWLWAASNQGLARFDGGQWSLLLEQPGLPDDAIRTLALIEEAGGPVLWVGSQRMGVWRLDVGNPAQPQPAAAASWPRPPDPTIYSILADSHGRIYICTNNGVQQLSPDGQGSYAERVMSRRDGMVHDECNTLSQSIDAFDRYFVGTLGGLSVFDPAQAPAAGQLRPKQIRLTEVQMDGRSWRLQGQQSLRFGPGSRELRIAYPLQSGVRESESRYRTRLLGYEEDYGPWTAEYRRNFTALPPGDYRFQIQARDYAGIDAAPVELSFAIEAFWWQRAWVQLSLLTMLLLLVMFGVLAYNRNLRIRQITLRREVAARTAELREANASLTELSYTDPLTGVANRRRLTEVLDAEVVRARQQQRRLGLIVIDVDHFKDYNDRHGHLAGDVALRAVAQALQQSVRPQDLVARFGGEEFCCLMVDAEEAVVASVAERMRQLVQALPPRQVGNDEEGVTISLGYASRVPAADEQAAGMLRSVDEALYQAKHAGRNRAMRADPEGNP